MNRGRLSSIDALKGFAIIAVLLLHSLNPDILAAIKSTIHIGQAVPIFALITFYLTYLSLEQKGGIIRNYYSADRVKKTSKRIVLPFFMVTSLQCVLLFYMAHFQPLKLLSGGGYGPGSYYVWIYLQIWVLAPLIYSLLKKNEILGTIIVYTVCIALNILCSYFCPKDLWRLLIVRYLSLSVIAWIWLKYASLNKRGKGFLIFLSILSLYYLLYYTHYDASPFIYPNSWVSQNYPVFFWTLILVVLCVKLIPMLPNTIRTVLEWLGVNSWEVFLAQMFFISCISINRFPKLYSLSVSQILYVLFVFVMSIGSVFIYDSLRIHFINKKSDD